MNRIQQLLLAGLMALFGLTACNPSFLDEIQDRSRVIPSSLEDFQAMMDNGQTMNDRPAIILSLISSDEYTISDVRYNAISDPESRNGYIWAEEIFEGIGSSDWNTAYKRILYSNTVLDGLQDIPETPQNKSARDQTLGSAYFFRAMAYFELSQLFAPPYDPRTASGELGLPLRLVSDINENPPRASVEATYQQMLSDLQLAASLLQDRQEFPQRPIRPAALGLLARVYLHMQRYEEALANAEACLSIRNELIDFSEVDGSVRYPFPTHAFGNPEVLFITTSLSPPPVTQTGFNLDTALYALYEDGDHRKDLFFLEENERRLFRGSYRGNYSFFTGVTTGEVYLTAAESARMSGRIAEASDFMDVFLRHRYQADAVPEVSTLDGAALLDLILLERRKELVCRGMRWWELRRLNRAGIWQVDLERTVNGMVYRLPANSPRYVFPLPDDALRLGGYQQNER